MCYNQTGDISTLEGTPLKLVDKFTYLGSSVESTEKDIETRLTKAWTAINRLSIIWKSDLTDKMKRSFFQAAVTSILLYGCTTWTLTKRLDKKLDGNYTRMLRAILNKSWQQHPTRHQLYGHLPPITKTIQVRRTRYAGHCWRSRDELIRDVLLWIPTHGRAKAGRPARTYIQQLCEDTGCCPEDLPRAMRSGERGSGISALPARYDDDDDSNQWTNETRIYKYISLILLSKGVHSLLLVCEIDGEAYTQRGDFLLCHIFFRESGDANACTPLQAVSSDDLTPLIGCVSKARLPILCLCLNLTT